MKFYRLDGHQPVPCSFDEWTSHPETRRVAFDRVDRAEISTVFLVHNHNFPGRGKPLLFETMVFGGPNNGWCRRYTTWDEAERGHATTVAAIRKGEEP